ncbi:hypothetical protein C8J56DRAFT_992670 [Mycena floridula]|nr:hypothetical protein C8J56DRAFT_992670 [Mycena floridula]
MEAASIIELDHTVQTLLDAGERARLLSYAELARTMIALEDRAVLYPKIAVLVPPLKFLMLQQRKWTLRGSDARVSVLFTKLKDVLSVLFDKQNIEAFHQFIQWDKSDTILSDLSEDIRWLFNLLSSYEKSSTVSRFVMASMWNDRFATCVMRLDNRRTDLQLVHQIYGAQSVDDIQRNIESTRAMVAKVLGMLNSPAEHAIEQWIQDKGGSKTVSEDSNKVADLLKLPGSLQDASAEEDMHSDTIEALNNFDRWQSARAAGKPGNATGTKTSAIVGASRDGGNDGRSPCYDAGIRRIEPYTPILEWYVTKPNMKGSVTVCGDTAAYLPFKLIYEQETARQDNDKKKALIFEKVKDVVRVLLGLKGLKKKENGLNPGEALHDRLKYVCEDIEVDIKACWNVIDAQEKRNPIVRFLKASEWNEELGIYIKKFEDRRQDIVLALSMRIAISAETMSSDIKSVKALFASSRFRTPQEHALATWFVSNDGLNALQDEEKYTELMKLQSTLYPEHKALTIDTLRQQLRDDVRTVLDENWKKYEKLFQMGLDQLKDSLSAAITQQGDRMVRAISGGPHTRIKDQMIYHIWKEHGWRGSAKTRHLVLAIRDHLFERIERSRIREIDDEDKPLVTHTGKNTDPPDEEDPEAHDLALGEPLQDAWSVDLLQVKHLRYLSEALDRDGSGFTTISEINVFTETRPVHWSLPRWISFWTVGWQLSAQNYCTEIEQIFHEMSSLRRDIGLRMPGNHVYISRYLDAVWHKVIGLTSSFSKPDLPNVPLEEYQDYIFGRETLLQKRLDNISYSIESVETVHLITGRTNIETQVFIILTLLLRKHRDNFRQCLHEEIDHGDVMSSIATVTYVIDAVWIRYMAIVDLFYDNDIMDVKQAFQSFCGGLFSNYSMWQAPDNLQIFRSRHPRQWMHTDPIHPSVSESRSRVPRNAVNKHPQLFTVQDRWSFLGRRILSSIRQRNMYARAMAARRYIILTYRAEIDSITQSESREWFSLRERFSPQQISLLSSIYQWHLRATSRHGVDRTCPCCNNKISRSRLMCLDCQKETAGSPIWCDKVECVHSKVLGSLPLNRHLVVKMRNSLLLKDHFEFESQARACLDSINDRYIRSTFGANEICMICNETRISLPAWYCVECSSVTPVCDDCERNIDSMQPWVLQRVYRDAVSGNNDGHHVFHALTRYHGPHAAAGVQPERPAWAEKMLMDIQDVQDQVNSIIASMEVRMDNMEQRITRKMEEIMTAAMMSSA